VGVACNNNGGVSGPAFTDNALWMSATSPADINLVQASSCLIGTKFNVHVNHARFMS